MPLNKPQQPSHVSIMCLLGQLTSPTNRPIFKSKLQVSLNMLTSFKWLETSIIVNCPRMCNAHMGSFQIWRQGIALGAQIRIWPACLCHAQALHMSLCHGRGSAQHNLPMGSGFLRHYPCSTPSLKLI